MAKKRRVPSAVHEQLERKRRLAATMAERQGAALGKPAREQLKPLLKAPPEMPALPEFTLAVDASAWNNAFTHALQSFSNSLRISFGKPEPSIDAAKLEALKTAEPVKVAPRVPDMVEVITGWRGWALSKSGRLEALGRDTVWPAKRALEAECDPSILSVTRGRHFAPAWDCNCGIWAFKDLDRLVGAVGTRYGSLCVLGTVSLWGRVIETENGYRAQYAYPAELWLLDDTLEELGRIYDVPVRLAGARP